MIRLQDIAPRIARARDQWVAYDNARQEAVTLERDNVLRLERLVAHRELQEVRAIAQCGRARSAGARRSAGDYLVMRQRKLKAAQQALQRAAKRLRDLEVWR